MQVFQTNTANAETFTIPFEGTFTGTGAATQITGAVTASAAIFNAPAAVVGGLINATGDNLWQGNVILQSSSTVAAAATTQLTVTGLVQDAAVSAAAFAVEAGTTPDPTTAPAGFTKAGAGVVSLAPATQVINLSNAVSARERADHFFCRRQQRHGQRLALHALLLRSHRHRSQRRNRAERRRATRRDSQ